MTNPPLSSHTITHWRGSGTAVGARAGVGTGTEKKQHIKFLEYLP